MVFTKMQNYFFGYVSIFHFSLLVSHSIFKKLQLFTLISEKIRGFFSFFINKNKGMYNSHFFVIFCILCKKKRSNCSYYIAQLFLGYFSIFHLLFWFLLFSNLPKPLLSCLNLLSCLCALLMIKYKM